MRKHPTDLLLESFLLDHGDEGREILFHLCECERCRQRFRRRPARSRIDAPRLPQEPPPPPQLSGNRQALGFATALVQERLEAPEFVVELLRRPVGARVSMVGTEERFWTWGVLELLIERSLATVLRDANEAEVLTALALLLTERLDAGFYGSERIEDLRARTWGHLANARRVRSDAGRMPTAASRA